jgi:hypothetical protein
MRTQIWPWLALAATLIVVGGLVLDGAAGSIVLACGFVVVFGAGVRFISRNDERPAEEPRVPAGHSGV